MSQLLRKVLIDEMEERITHHKKNLFLHGGTHRLGTWLHANDSNV